MVTFNVYKSTSSGAYVEGVCLATDTKPIAGITNGSILYAVDITDGSVKRYMFNQNAAAWVEAEDPCAGGGSGLPEVSASNNGNVLTVVSGEWAAAAPSGGGAYFITPELAGGGAEIHFEEPYSVLKQKLLAGTMIYLHMDMVLGDVTEEYVVAPLVSLWHNIGGDYYAAFAKTGVSTEEVIVYTFSASSEISPMSWVSNPQ